MGRSSKDKRDIYYRLAKEQGWRARSAFKLIQIDEAYNIFDDVTKVVDLCAAPGSWSQVLSRRLAEFEDSRVVAVDLQKMAPIEGVIQVQGDITKLTTAQEIMSHFAGDQADLVVCDGAPDVTGIHDMDEWVQAQLLLSALLITSRLLKEGGTFAAKIFKAEDVEILTEQMRLLFAQVIIYKPSSSREASSEHFVIGKGFKLPEGFDTDGLALAVQGKTCNKEHIPFLSFGDLSNYDNFIKNLF